MCGIAGVVGKVKSLANLEKICDEMQLRMEQRGPDDKGLFMDASHTVGLVHTRLSILDLSSAGHQPMQSQNGQFTIVFNGEIYNFRELRAELEELGSVFRSDSDTEVLLEMFCRYGRDCVQRFVGMYAFAIWDSQTSELFAARGPFGIKPFYYWDTDAAFAFSSEIRSLLASGVATPELDGGSLYEYLVSGTPQEPDTLIRGVKTLPPGHTLTLKKGRLEISPFWEIKFPASAMSKQDAVDSTRKALEQSIERHFVSDVPVGIFLSGGIDSTAILALAKARGFRDLHTFCITFDEVEFDEGPIARRTAEHFGATHHEWKLTPEIAFELLPEFTQAIDQPSIDGFNVFCVSKFARREGLKVVLSGLGGDEMFGSYPSFSVIPNMLRWHRRITTLPLLGQVAGKLLSVCSSNHRIRRLGHFLCANGTSQNAYKAMRGTFTENDAAKLLARFGFDPARYIVEESMDARVSDFELSDQISYHELTRYMLNQLLRDSDVMSMANGLELRVPFVDSELMRTVAQIPAALRLESGKRLLLDAVPEIPDWVANRPKRGFAFPFEKWIHSFWGTEFQRIQGDSPVPLTQWYQKWSLFALEQFLATNEVSVPSEKRKAS